MAVGDSITQGGTGFESYTAPLWSMLYGAGYAFDFIGPNSFACRTGSVANCGYGGRTAEYLDSKIDSLYARYPADVVLLLAGHNHFAEENPVDGIVTAQRSIITKILARNPEAKILVGEVIPAGKLPKYSYIPALNSALERMVRQLDNDNVKWVPAAEGFDWQRHTVADKVHPNRAGAEIIAANWMKALRAILPRPANEYHPDVECYKRLDDGTSLNLHIFRPDGNHPRGGRAAIVYFFAGGWTSGSPLQFYRECATYAAAGIVAITAEYRIGMVHGSSPAQSVEDARDAMAWVRRNADTLGIDPSRIAAAGSSAGGHLAAALATLPGMPERPDLLLLYYPVVDTSDRGDSFGDEERARALSPMQHISHPPAADTLHRRGQRPHSPRRHGRTFPRPHAAIWRLLRFAHIPRRHPPVIQLPPHPRQHILQDRASDNRLPSSPRLPHTPCRRPPAARNAAQAKGIGDESRREIGPELCNKGGHPYD